MPGKPRTAVSVRDSAVRLLEKAGFKCYKDRAAPDRISKVAYRRISVETEDKASVEKAIESLGKDAYVGGSSRCLTHRGFVTFISVECKGSQTPKPKLY
jgi:hypothetical protein